MTVIGSAERAAEIPGSADDVDAEELQRYATSDVNRALRRVPGLYLIEVDGYGLRPNIGIRGSGTDRNNRIAVMEDGVLIAPAAYAAPAAYYFPTVERMTAIEVRKGSASIRSGPRTTGGAINLVSTPIPAEQIAGRVSLVAGQDSTYNAHAWAGGSGDQFGFLVEAVQQGSDGFKEIDGDRSFEVTAASRAALTAAAEATTHKLVEDITEIKAFKALGTIATLGTALAKGIALSSGVAKLIIARAFLGVFECFVGFAELLELGVVTTVPVRMVFHGQFAVGFFDLISGGRFGDA